MGTADSYEVAGLHAASWREIYTGIASDDYLTEDLESDRLRFWNKRLASPHTDEQGWIASIGDHPVGFVYVLGDAHPLWGTRIHNLHVARHARGRGVAKELIWHACEWIAATSSVHGVWLWVYAENRSAVSFYESIGGVSVEQEMRVVPGGGEARGIRYAWPSAGELQERIGRSGARGER